MAVVMLLMLLAFCVSECAAGVSPLLQKWKEQGGFHLKLPDFSFAGYGAGETPIPNFPVVANLVTDFGAKKDGSTNIATALKNAISEQNGSGGVIYLPAGEYKLETTVSLNNLHDVGIRGDPNGGTKIVLPKSLFEVKGKGNCGGNYGYGYCGSFISLRGKDSIANRRRVGGIVGDTAQGARVLRLASDANWSDVVSTTVGSGEVRNSYIITMSDSDTSSSNSLMRALLGSEANVLPTCDQGDGQQNTMPFRWVTRIVRVDQAKGEVELDRPVPMRMLSRWSPTLHRWTPSFSKFGIVVEHLHFVGQSKPLAGHHDQRSYSPLTLNGFGQSVVRNIKMERLDNGVFMDSSVHLTAQGFSSPRAQQNEGDYFSSKWRASGHHGALLTRSHYSVFEDFDMPQLWIHSISFKGEGNHNVVRNGKGIHIRVDQHGAAGWAVAISNVEVDSDPAQVLWAGGSSCVMPHAAGTVLYNVRAKNGAPFPSLPSTASWPNRHRGDYPRTIILGASSASGSMTGSFDSHYFETRPAGGFDEPDLVAAQATHRLGSAVVPAPAPVPAPASVPAPAACVVLGGDLSQFQFITLPDTYARFTLTFSVSVSASAGDFVFGLTDESKQSDFGVLAATVRLYKNGQVEVRGPTSYTSASTPVKYVGNTMYKLQFRVDTPARTFAAFVDDVPVMDEESVGFRATATSVTSLSQLAIACRESGGTCTICGIDIVDDDAPPSPPLPSPSQSHLPGPVSAPVPDDDGSKPKPLYPTVTPSSTHTPGIAPESPPSSVVVQSSASGRWIGALTTASTVLGMTCLL